MESIRELLMLSDVPLWSDVLMELSRNLQQTLDQQHLYSRSVDYVNDSTHCDAGAAAALKV
jgi:hypothetical protein